MIPTCHLVFLFLLISTLILPAVAQTPRAARDAFKERTKSYEEGDFDKAIAYFTKAIEISSHLNLSRDELTSTWTGAFDSGARREREEIIIVDSLAAQAYLSC